MTSGADSSGSCLSSKRNSKTEDNYLKELNEDLKLRKQELLEMLKPLEDKNNLLFQKLMANLEEKQRSLQIMRQIMTGKGCDESSVMELIKEAEEMKQNLLDKHISLFGSSPSNRKRKTRCFGRKWRCYGTRHLSQKSSAINRKHHQQNQRLTCRMERRSFFHQEKQQRKMEWVKYQEQANILQNDFHGKVIELRIEALKNYQKSNDLKLSLYLQQNFEPKQAVLNVPRSQGKMGTTAMRRATTTRNEPNMRTPESKTYPEKQAVRESQSDDVGERLFFLGHCQMKL